MKVRDKRGKVIGRAHCGDASAPVAVVERCAIPDWSGQIVAVVASGPSAADAGVDQLRGVARVIAVNSSWRLVPWADMIYATDYAWWKQHHKDLTLFTGARFAAAGKRIERDFPGVSALNVPPPSDARRSTIITTPRGLIGSGGNSGFQAINVAIHTNAKRLILVGFDMNLLRGSHWHGDHTGICKNPQPDLMRKWCEALDAQAAALHAHGVDVVNASPVSALKRYRQSSIKEALEQWTL
jgi:hypothetical protein